MESVSDYLLPYLSTYAAERISALQGERARGTRAETDFQQAILEVLKHEKGLSAAKQAMNRDFRLNSKTTDHFLARLMARHGNTCIDFIMRKVEYGISQSRKSGRSKVFTHDCSITFDPLNNTLISIYPKTSLTVCRASSH